MSVTIIQVPAIELLTGRATGSSVMFEIYQIEIIKEKQIVVKNLKAKIKK